MSNGRVLVMCPSLRSERFKGLVSSVLDTSEVADVAGYAPREMRGSYSERADRMEMTFGEPLGLVPALNLLAGAHPGYGLYGFAPDDSIFTSPGWDRHLLGLAAGFPRDIGMTDVPYSGDAEDGGAWIVECPFVSERWIATVGWYACPRFDHWYWHVISGLIGLATYMVKPRAKDANIKHFMDHSTCGTRMSASDSSAWMALIEDIPLAVQRLRGAMLRPEPN